MQFLDGSFGTASVAIADLIRDHGAAIPAETYAALAGFWPSPVDRVCYGAEALYAAGDELPAPALELCAQLANMAQAFSWHEIGQTDRGVKVIAACRRRLGELTAAEAPPAEDPAPLAEYVPAPAE